MEASPHLLFQSSLFEVHPDEDKETNPGIFGKSLALWLGRRLVSPEFSVDDVIAEDFGWCVPVAAKEMNVYLACSSTDTDRTEWRVFVFAEGGMLGRLLGRVKPHDVVAEVFTRLKSTLSQTDGINNLRAEEE